MLTIRYTVAVRIRFRVSLGTFFGDFARYIFLICKGAHAQGCFVFALCYGTNVLDCKKENASCKVTPIIIEPLAVSNQ